MAAAKGIRISALAKELGVESKAVLTRIWAEGLQDKVPNHMTVIPLGLAESVRDWFNSNKVPNRFSSFQLRPIGLGRVPPSQLSRATGNDVNARPATHYSAVAPPKPGQFKPTPVRPTGPHVVAPQPREVPSVNSGAGGVASTAKDVGSVVPAEVGSPSRSGFEEDKDLQDLRRRIGGKEYRLVITESWSVLQKRLKDCYVGPKRLAGDGFNMQLIDECSSNSPRIRSLREPLHWLRKLRNEADKDRREMGWAEAELAFSLCRIVLRVCESEIVQGKA